MINQTITRHSIRKHTMTLYDHIRKGLLLLALFSSMSLSAAIGDDVSTPQNAIPPNIATPSNKPMVMLTASNHHSLFDPMYNDLEDLDGDGVIDNTFKPTFTYSGYFDATKCYRYRKGVERFVPVILATKVRVATAGTMTATRYSCPKSSPYWSGNFLNWATTTRLDTVRKMLYGGYRSMDTMSTTVLMGTRLIRDAHSFVKFYKGDDIRDYTPFTREALTKATGVNGDRYAGLSICLTGTLSAPKTSEPVMRLVKGNVRFWSITNPQSLTGTDPESCAWRPAGSGATSWPKPNFGPKLSRAYYEPILGNGGIYHETSIPSKAEDGAYYGDGDTIGPELTVQVEVCDAQLLGAERCQAFPPTSTTPVLKPFGLLQEFGYSKTNGDSARAEFGLISGSYDNYFVTGTSPRTAGALRKNMDDLEDEINRATGVFCHSPGSACPPALPDGRTTGNGIIKTFDFMNIDGRDWNRDYNSAALWTNPLGEMLAQTLLYYAYDGKTSPGSRVVTQTQDKKVGIPVAAWRDPFVDSAERRNKYGNAVCRPLNILLISSSSISHDLMVKEYITGIDSFVNGIGNAEGITGTIRSVGAVPGNDAHNNSCAAKMVGELSTVSGICPEVPSMQGNYQVAGVALYGNTRKIRSVQNLPVDFSTVANALKVKTAAISFTGGATRIDIPVPARNAVIGATPLIPATPRKYVSITPESVQDLGVINAPLSFTSISSSPTHGAFIVSWGTNLPSPNYVYDMDILGFLRYDLSRNPGSPSGWDITISTDILNACSDKSGTHGFSIIGVQDNNGFSANGRYLTHQFFVKNGTTILTDRMPPTSQYRCGDAEYRSRNVMDFRQKKYTDWIYADTVCRVMDDSKTDNSSAPDVPNFCTVQNKDFLHRERFRAIGEENALLKEPLWYVGKYGSFRSETKNPDGSYTDKAMPTDVTDWDNLIADGSVGQDGVPDAYFLARRPELLEAQLRNAINVAIRDSNVVPAIASTQLAVDSRKYLTKFDSTTVSGTLEAYKMTAEGNFEALPEWDAGKLLSLRTRTNAGTDRAIITNHGNGLNNAGGSAGQPFRWGSLPQEYKDKMTLQSTNNLSASNAELALNYIRGDQTLEGVDGLRPRGDNLLGPVVNAAPWIQGRPAAGIRSDGYEIFSREHKIRNKLLWLAANDGMLHAFNPDTGAEVFAYVPGALADRLAEIPLKRGASGRTQFYGYNFVSGIEKHPPGTAVWPYVDGNPFSADVWVDSGPEKAWKTYVFGTLGRGGKGIFALDATTVTDLTENRAASIFKWQFTSDDDPDLGYITGDVSIHPGSNQAAPVAKMNNGKYALLLGNGNKSASGKAVFYVIYVNGPDGVYWNGRYQKIVVDAGPGNGLSMLRWEDMDGDGTADVAYAGDLKGNLWKFNLESKAPAEWKVAFQTRVGTATVNQPLYVASDAITTAPQLMFMGPGGLMVNFATGNAFGDEDFPKTTVTQRVYGIWDRPGIVGTRPINTSTLALREYTRDSAGVVLIRTATPLNWSVHNGWFMDLPARAEAVLSDPSMDAGILSFVTVRPKFPPGPSAPCTSTYSSAFYAIDPISGQPERNIYGNIMLDGTKRLIFGKPDLGRPSDPMHGKNKTLIAAQDIGDQKVRLVIDRTLKGFTRACKSGEIGCTCQEKICTKDVSICSPGQRAKRLIGNSADGVLCASITPRLQWREIPGLRTDQ